MSLDATSLPPLDLRPPPSGADGGPSPLRLGSQGPEVETRQRELNLLGEHLPVSGQFGPRMLEAVKRFQRSRGIVPADGLLRPKTAAALTAASQAVQHGGWSATGGTHVTSSEPSTTRDVQNRDASASRSADSQFVSGTRGWVLEKKRCLSGLSSDETRELNAARADPKQSKQVPGAVTADAEVASLRADPLAQGVFAQKAGWTELRHDERFAQRYQVRNGHMYTETKAVLSASVDDVAKQLQGPWTWWHKGSQSNRVEHPESGTVDYELKPTGHGIDVRETMHAPERLQDGGLRIQIDMKGPSVFGKAYFEIHPDGAGKSVVMGRFAGATTPANPLQSSVGGVLAGLMGPETVAKNHLLAEGGDLPAYLGGPGTGWVGLGEKLGWGGRP
jgi:hypothetical protein